MPHLTNRISRYIALALVIVVTLVIAMPSFADDVTGSLVVNAGTLAMTTSDNPTFAAVTLDGTDQTRTDAIDISVEDFTGSGDGWNLQITSTTFTDGVNTLPTTAMSITGVNAVCAGDTCTDPSNSIGYPLTVLMAIGAVFVKTRDA